MSTNVVIEISKKKGDICPLSLSPSRIPKLLSLLAEWPSSPQGDSFLVA